MRCNCDVVELRINSIIHFIGVDYLKQNLLGSVQWIIIIIVVYVQLAGHEKD